MKAFLLLLMLAAYPSEALAAHTEEEKAAFFARQRQEKADFELKMLAEQDSRVAARRAFAQKAAAERAAFMSGIRSLPVADKKQAMNDYNARARQAKADFEQKLPGEKPNELEKKLADFDKTSNRSAKAQAQRTLIIQEAEKQRQAKLNEFKLNQLNKTREFNES